MRHVIAAAALVAASGVAVAGNPNLLNNGGFESAITFDFSNPFNWNAFFGGPAGVFLQNFNDTGATPFEGAQAALLTIRGVPAGPTPTQGFDSFVGQFQRVDGIVAGATYEYAIHARELANASNAAEFRIEWQNADGAEISRINVEIQDQLTADYQRFAIEAVAPTGAARAVVVFALQSFTNNGQLANISVAFDAASFVLVPAPASMALLGLGGLAAARRRR